MRYKASVILVLAVLLTLLVSFFIPELRENESSENRTMATFDMVLHPNPESIAFRDTPVERLDAALSDQFPFRETLVKKYLSIFNSSESFVSSIVQIFFPREANQYSLKAIGKYYLIEDTNYITGFPRTTPMDPDIVKRRVDQIEQLHAEFPDLKIYAYYVSQAYDMPWWDDFLGTQTHDYFQQIVDAVPDYVSCGHLIYNDLSDYMDLHYKTDHHWNHRGALQGYQDICAMMAKDFDVGPVLEPVSENDVSATYDFVYRGSYGSALRELYQAGYDSFSFYEYDFPEEEYAILNSETLAEAPVVSMGLYDEYRRGEIDKKVGVDHYKTMYRVAVGADGTRYTEQYPYIIRNKSGNGRNLLLCGDSYSRAVRDLLASNFDTLVCVDYRIIHNNPIDYLIRRYDIDTLLICSNNSMWDSEDYLFTFEKEAGK